MTASQAVKHPPPRLAMAGQGGGSCGVSVWRNTPPEKRKHLRKSQPWSEDLTAKLFCNVEF